MKKSEFTKQIIGITGSPLVNLTEIAKLARTNRAGAADLMRGCHYEKRGRGKYFFASDVAERMMARMEVY